MEQGMLLARSMASLCVEIGLVVHHEALNDQNHPLGMAHSTESFMVTKQLIEHIFVESFFPDSREILP